MSGDYSRLDSSASPLKDYREVLMQQGRVQLDADWNELVDIVDRRIRAQTVDTIGLATVPKQTPDGFKIALTGGVPTIGAGRMYVDGLLAENHGQPHAAAPQLDSGQLTEFDASPIVFMYRHAVELHLKALVLGDGGNFLATKPDTLSIYKTHSVPWLASTSPRS